jgi:hypothetical protein
MDTYISYLPNHQGKRKKRQDEKDESDPINSKSSFIDTLALKEDVKIISLKHYKARSKARKSLERIMKKGKNEGDISIIAQKIAIYTQDYGVDRWLCNTRSAYVDKVIIGRMKGY